KEAGTVLLGKVNLDEFTMGSSTENSAAVDKDGKRIETKNPWDLSRVPGGSSGGSAVAVAADEAFMSIGTDTGGSIRLPSSYCSVTGLKVSYGLVPRYGVISYASSFDTIGPINKTVADLAITLNTIAGNDIHDSTSVTHKLPDYTTPLGKDIKGLKIGIPKEYYGEGLDSEVSKILEQTKETFRKMGAEIVDISLPLTKYAIATYYILVKSEASSNLSRYDGIRYGHSALKTQSKDAKVKTLQDIYLESRSEGFGPEVKRSIMMGTHTLSSGYYDAYYKGAAKVRTLIKKEFEQAFKEVDIMLAPACPFPAFRFGDKMEDPLSMYLADINTGSINIGGVPAMSIPAGFTSEGLPVGAQLIGPMWGEETLIRAGDAFQRETDFHLRKPQLNNQ
ncbi:MAG TPA: amidase family protein, partial [bacterium]|nr:amidase family protein [bacterium]